MATAAARWLGLVVPLDKSGGGLFAPRSGSEVLRSDLALLLGTRLGSRLMVPEFGSLLPTRVFEPNDRILHSFIKSDATDAILRWEARRLRLREITPEVDRTTFRAVVRYIELESNLEDVVNVGFTRLGG